MVDFCSGERQNYFVLEVQTKQIKILKKAFEKEMKTASRDFIFLFKMQARFCICKV